MTVKQRQHIQDLVENDLLEEAIEVLKPLTIALQHKNELATISAALKNLESNSLTISPKDKQSGRQAIGVAILNLADRVLIAAKILAPRKPSFIIYLIYLGMSCGVFIALYVSAEQQSEWRTVQVIAPVGLGLIFLYHQSLIEKSRLTENIAEYLKK